MSGGRPVETVGGSLDEALARGAALLDTDPSLALKQAQVILRKDGREPRALRLAAAAHRARGEADFAAKAELLAIDEARRYPLLNQAAKALSDGNFPAASELAARHLKDFPGDLAAIVLSAESALGIGLHDKAIPLLKMVLERAPGFAHAGTLLVNGLMLSDQLAEARKVLEPLVAAAPDDIGLLTLQNRLLAAAGDFQGCVETTQKLIDLKPKSPDFHADHADALRFVGRSEDAKAAYRKALGLDPDHARSWWSLADLDASSLTDDDIAYLAKRLETAGFKGEREINLHFALAMALHARERFDEAFAHFEAGNGKRRQADPFDATEFEQLMTRHLDHVGSIGPATAATGEDPLPLFIVGMPRAGSTLLERMLGQSPDIEPLGELQVVSHMVQRLMLTQGREALPQTIAGLNDKALASMGTWYRNRAREMMRSKARIVIDKMHMNWRHLPLILRMLPNAKIIDIRRDPMDCCWSNYRTLFARGHAASSDLEDIASFYRTYSHFTDAMRERFPDRIKLVEYEQLVDRPHEVLREVCDFLGVTFDESMLAFHQSSDAVATASSEQVRQPLNRKGIGAWKDYQTHLVPLSDALGEQAAS